VRWEGQLERRRGEFVDAAMRAIAEHGPDVSTTQIAAEAGVARTRIYRHFEDAADLQAAIAGRALEMVLGDLEPLWKPEGSPMQMIGGIVDTLIGYLSENRNLYRYLTKYAPSARGSDSDVVTDVKTAIANHVANIFTYYLDEFEAETKMAELDAFTMVGMVETAISRWLDYQYGVTREELSAHLTRWIWILLDQGLRDAGVELDPNARLAPPDLGLRARGGGGPGTAGTPGRWPWGSPGLGLSFGRAYPFPPAVPFCSTFGDWKVKPACIAAPRRRHGIPSESVI
jgi:AcrR family transcriptional regulator